uniref:Uncharacterized protein n=1 Tax=mine drainage metagenome TaxID=410659 RepID=E6PKP3_9ZZZZ
MTTVFAASIQGLGHQPTCQAHNTAGRYNGTA